MICLRYLETSVLPHCAAKPTVNSPMVQALKKTEELIVATTPLDVLKDLIMYSHITKGMLACGVLWKSFCNGRKQVGQSGQSFFVGDSDGIGEIQRVLTEANATSASSPSATDDNNNNNNAATSGGGVGGMSNLFPGGIPSNAMGGSLGGPGMEAAMQSMLSNPQMLQNLMSVSSCCGVGKRECNVPT